MLFCVSFDMPMPVSATVIRTPFFSDRQYVASRVRKDRVNPAMTHGVDHIHKEITEYLPNSSYADPQLTPGPHGRKDRTRQDTQQLSPSHAAWKTR